MRRCRWAGDASAVGTEEIAKEQLELSGYIGTVEIAK